MREPLGLREALAPSIESLGYELIGIESNASRQSGYIRLYIDHADGISVTDCETVSRQVSAVLDVTDLMPGPYRLEVSSPGLDRPLFQLSDFERFAGQRVQMKLAVPIEGRRNFKGSLVGVRDGHIIVSHDDVETSIAFDDIDRARLIPEL